MEQFWDFMVGWKLVGEKLHDIYTNACNMNDMVCNIDDVCGRQWHICWQELGIIREL